jgi:hypothetical protein
MSMSNCKLLIALFRCVIRIIHLIYSLSEATPNFPSSSHKLSRFKLYGNENFIEIVQKIAYFNLVTTEQFETLKINPHSNFPGDLEGGYKLRSRLGEGLAQEKYH